MKKPARPSSNRSDSPRKGGAPKGRPSSDRDGQPSRRPASGKSSDRPATGGRFKRDGDGEGFKKDRPSSSRSRDFDKGEKPVYRSSKRTDFGGDRERSGGARPARDGKPSYGKRPDTGKSEGRSSERSKDFSPRDKKPYGTRSNNSENSDRPYSGRPTGKSTGGYRKNDDDRPRKDGDARKSSFGYRKADGDRPERGGDNRKSSFGYRKAEGDRPSRDGERKPYGKRADKPNDRPNRYDSDGKPPRRPRKDWDEEPEADEKAAKSDSAMTLNKYLAHSGVSSRRDAAEMIKLGKVLVNGQVHTSPGYRVKPEDIITFEGKRMAPTKNRVYVLLNKPKGFITTTEDDQDRRTVMELVQGVEADRIFPVGRLDRNTTGLLLLTNDGDLAQKLSHPRYEAKKIYQVTLDKPLTKADFEKILQGVELEDGVAHADKLAYLAEKNELGLEIHSGKNRIVRRIFEALGYDVEKLDRVMYAGLTKKNIPRGKWRLLTDKEVLMLKHFKS